jgi:hypothetical protein
MIPLELRFTICWAISEGGSNPTLEYLIELQGTNPEAFISVIDGIEKLQDSKYLGPPLVMPLPVSKKVRDLRELRVDGGKPKIFSRIAMMYTPLREIILLNGVSKKTNKALPKFTSKAVTMRAQLNSKEMSYEEIPIKDIRNSL